MSIKQRLLDQSPCKPGEGVNIYLDALREIEGLERELRSVVDDANSLSAIRHALGLGLS